MFFVSDEMIARIFCYLLYFWRWICFIFFFLIIYLCIYSGLVIKCPQLIHFILTNNISELLTADELIVTRVNDFLTWPMTLLRDRMNIKSVPPLNKIKSLPPLNKSNSISVQLATGFECPVCGRRYKLKSSLRNHQKWECGKEPQFNCPFCPYKAKQKMHVIRHMERMHKSKELANIENASFEKEQNITV